MPSSSTARGTRWETEVAEYLSALGLPARRSDAREGPRDVGDIVGLDYFTVDAKDHGKYALSDWLDQAEQEAVNASKPFGAVVVKRPRRPTAEAYVVMSLSDFRTLNRIIQLRS